MQTLNEEDERKDRTMSEERYAIIFSRDKKIFLFGTAGFGGSEAYYQKILANVRTAIDASNTVVGEYMCQGRMPQAVRDRYVKMKEMPDAKLNLDALIENFDQALSHPDQEDLEKLRRMIAG